MKKTIKIEGMMCEHCAAAVKNALAAIGADAKINLKKGTATVTGDVEHNLLKKAVEDAGYTVTQIE